MKWVCSVCGHVLESEEPPENCPLCHVPGSLFKKLEDEKSTS